MEAVAILGEKPSKSPAVRVSRRPFLAAVAVPLVLPPGVLGQPGRPGANDRVVTGHIGVGKRGRLLLQHLRTNAAAVCDVDARHLREGAALVGPGVRLFDDYRRLLEDRDIDAVVIATPDHWHALQAIHACEAGKDVFLEVPAVRLPGEAHQLLRAANWFARVVHCPPAVLQPETASPRGAAKRILAWGPPDPDAQHAAGPVAPPEELDWDRWLGPAPYRPYHPLHAHQDWRWVSDLGGGVVRQTGALLFAAALETVGGFPEGRVGVRAKAGPRPPGSWDCPSALEAFFEFAGGLELVWRQPGGPDQPDPAGVRWERMEPDADTVESAAAGLAPASSARARVALEEWLDAVRARDTATQRLDTALRAGVLGTLANVAGTLGRGFAWDPATGTVSGDEQARRMLAFTGRGAYTL